MQVPIVLPTGPLVFVQAGTRFAVRFDAERFETKGAPVTLLEGIRQARSGQPLISYSDVGSIVYLPAGGEAGSNALVWVDRAGIEAQPRNLLTSRILPGEIHLERSPGHHRQFVESVRSRGKTLTTPDVSLRSATPGFLGLISIMTGRRIRWDPRRQEIVGDECAARMLARPMRSPWSLNG